MLEITGVEIRFPSPLDLSRPIRAYAAVTFCECVRVDNFTVKRSKDGRLFLDHPVRPAKTQCDRCGDKSYATLPLCGRCGEALPAPKTLHHVTVHSTPEARGKIERAVLHAYDAATTSTSKAS